MRAAALLRNKKKSDFGSYSLYLALHEGFLRYCTGSISVRYFQVARGLWQGLRAAALLCNLVQRKKKSDFGSYSLYLALHEVFLRYCTGSISVRYFQVARGLWQGLRAAALCNKKKSDFGSYSLYLALHEVFLRYCTGSISVQYFQVAPGVWHKFLPALGQDGFIATRCLRAFTVFWPSTLPRRTGSASSPPRSPPLIPLSATSPVAHLQAPLCLRAAIEPAWLTLVFTGVYGVAV